MPTPQQIESALAKVRDETSFIQTLLIDILEWPIDPTVKTVEDISYEWTKDELKANDLDKKIVEGKIRQIALPGCPWGIFIVEFKNPDVFQSGRGMTVPLRKVLAGLVPRQRKAAHLPSFFRQHLLFICTHNYQHFRFVHFKDPGESFKQPPLASFGWWPGDSTKTVSNYNLPHLLYLGENATVDDWLNQWNAAFDVERVTDEFYGQYKIIHATFRDQLQGVTDPTERSWLASILLNRLMFVYFLQKKGFLDSGNQSYLEDKLKASRGKDRFFKDFLTLLFFEGFAKPPERRSEEAKAKLGDIRYLNGGLFLPHPIEQRAAKAGKAISLPDSAFAQLLKLFGSFSWNLNDKPGGQDNEINPDVLGYIVEKYINQKAFGAYYTRPEITGYLCERTIHRLILDRVNTSTENARKLGVPVREYKTIGEMLGKLDNPLATKLLDEVLPLLSLLDPACGSGAFLVAAMKTLIDIYAGIFGWIKFNGSPELKARLKKIEGIHPSIDYFIKKRIITDNLYGVDIMEEAVEIARLRLFLALAASANTVEELEPLPNIDFNILRGNSLIGLLNVDAKRVEATNRTGSLGGLLFSQESYADVLAERNRQLEIYRHTGTYADDLTALRDQISSTNAKAQNALDEILLADFETLGIKFEEATWDDKKGAEGKPKKRPLKLEDIQALHPFHWAFAFDKVMSRGGFDGIITNPPWEIVKPNGKEFFEQHSDLVTKKSMSIHDFEKEQKKLLKDSDIRSAWLDYLSSYPHQSAYYRSAPDYSNQIGTINGKKVGSDLDLYKLFTERCFRLLHASGQCGLVIPSSICGALGAKQLRVMIFNQTALHGIFSFENRGKGVFENVHASIKPTIITFTRGGKTIDFPVAFMRTDLAELELFPQPTSMRMTVGFIERLSPDSLSIMEFKQRTDVSIAQKLLRFPLLGEDIPEKWKLSLHREFDMTNDSDLFESSPRKGAIKLYEGKMIWQFDHQYAQPRFWVDELAGRAKIVGKSGDPKAAQDYESFRLGYRSAGENTNERNFISTIVPGMNFCGNSLIVSKGINGQLDLLCYLCGLFNSYVLDYFIRLKITRNMNKFYIYQMPVPRLVASDRERHFIVQNAAKLLCTTPEFDELAKSVGLNPPNHKAGVTDPAGRAILRAELDAMVAHLYCLTEEEFTHILSTFPLVENEVKAAALAEFKRMAASGEAAIFNPDLAKPTPAAADPALVIKELIKGGESATVEFKSSARWDVKNNKAEKFIERIIVKTVAAFLNADGGTLVIGVQDDGSIYGLAEDYKLSGDKGRDSFELWLMQMLLKDFGKDAAGQIALAFHQLATPNPARPGSADVCVVTVKPSPIPRFVVENGQELFFIRTGNASNQLKPSELLGYCAQRWPGR